MITAASLIAAMESNETSFQWNSLCFIISRKREQNLYDTEGERIQLSTPTQAKSWPEHYACGFKDIWLLLLAKTDNSFTSFLEKPLEILKKNPGCR